MKKITPYRVTYTRVGAQESWAGWRVAGQTSDTPNAVLDECAKLQDSNAGAAGDLYENTHAREVYEWVCKSGVSKGENIYFSKLQFGMLDDAGGRPSMRADSISVPVGTDFNLLKTPEEVLSIDRKCFDNQLSIDEKRDENGRLDFSLVTEEDGNTAFESMSYDTDDEFEIESVVNELFDGNKEKYFNLIKCTYWALLFNSASTIYLVGDFELEKKFKLFALILRSVAYPFRSALSFRTLELASSFATTFVFSDRIPDGKRFYEISTGRNNILNDAVDKKLERNTFVPGYIDAYKKSEGDKYYASLSKKMTELASPTSDDPKLLNVADIFVSEGDISDFSEKDDKEIRQKLLKFLKLSVKNNKIDEYIADLLTVVLERKIELISDVQLLIDKKLAVTSNEELILTGYKYRAVTLVENADREAAYKQFGDLRNNKDMFKNVRKRILTHPDGSEFLDGYYGEYYAPKNVKTVQEIAAFNEEIQDLTTRKKSLEYMKTRCVDMGRDIIAKFAATKLSLVNDFNEYKIFLGRTFSSALVDHIVNELKRGFWKTFSFTEFVYDNKQSYNTLAYRSAPKCELCTRIIDKFGEAEKMRITSVEAFNKLVKNDTSLSQKEKDYLFKLYQKHCIRVCTEHSKRFDFWYAVGKIGGNAPAKFMYDNKLPVLVGEFAFEDAMTESEFLTDLDKLDAFLREIEDLKKANDDKSLAAVATNLKKMYSSRQKEHKVRVKQQEKSSERNAREHSVRDRKSVEPSRAPSGRHYKTDNEVEKKRSSVEDLIADTKEKKKRRGFLDIFKNKK